MIVHIWYKLTMIIVKILFNMMSYYMSVLLIILIRQQLNGNSVLQKSISMKIE